MQEHVNSSAAHAINKLYGKIASTFSFKPGMPGFLIPVLHY